MPLRLCTEEDFQKLPLNTPPEMQRSDLAASVLQLKALGIDNVVKFEFPSAPPSKNLIACLELLYALGAIDDAGALTRPLGENMCELPVHPTVAKMLLGAGDFGCSQEIAVIVAMLQAGLNFEISFYVGVRNFFLLLLTLASFTKTFHQLCILPILLNYPAARRSRTCTLSRRTSATRRGWPSGTSRWPRAIC